jgi:hypothetical protein
MLRGTRSICGLFVITSCALLAQAPTTAAAQLPPRLAIEDAFLAAPRLPERVEVNGRIGRSATLA